MAPRRSRLQIGPAAARCNLNKGTDVNRRHGTRSVFTKRYCALRALSAFYRESRAHFSTISIDVFLSLFFFPLFSGIFCRRVSPPPGRGNEIRGGDNSATSASFTARTMVRSRNLLSSLYFDPFYERVRARTHARMRQDSGKQTPRTPIHGQRRPKSRPNNAQTLSCRD